MANALTMGVKKTSKSVKNKYFRSINGVKWTFTADVQDRRGNPKTISLLNIQSIPKSLVDKLEYTD